MYRKGEAIDPFCLLPGIALQHLPKMQGFSVSLHTFLLGHQSTRVDKKLEVSPNLVTACVETKLWLLEASKD